MKNGLQRSLSSARVFLTKASAWLRRKSAESVQKPKAALDRWDQDVDDTIGVQPSQSLAKIITSSLVVMSAATFAWLAIATTDEVVKAKGKLQPIDDVKVVQMPLGGVLKEMLVKDGERVRKDQILLRLDNEATLERAKSTSEEIRAKEAQLKLKQIELERYLSLNDARMRVLKRKLDLHKTILARLERLSKLGASPELQYLQQVNEVAEVEGELETTVIVRERQLAILNQSLEKLKGELADLKGKLTEITVNIRYKDIRSPVDGVVFDLKPTGLGYVAQSSEPVMKIVPYDALLAKINIDSADIGFVRAGKQVDISIDSFPANDFGVIEGTIDRIGSDALPPNQRENFYRYPAMIKLNTQQLKLRSGKQLPLQAGMSLTANIKLRKVTWLQLLLGGFRDKTDSLKQL
ncbi:HlyD family secretion protein [Prochlorococcus marinus]|uniref:HlyD family secretion protein n=1 Tax=Prochlorococcus marinus TaxID=1219 RepID=UPI0007BC7E79|nr:HlyD family efflux transporter periplasmic adaptor subunit [Prochlorococcus marinus]KZR78366.1 Hemolysin secretion protein D, plasmid [Prochlorococcus marinus str. MIT 1320]